MTKTMNKVSPDYNLLHDVKDGKLSETTSDAFLMGGDKDLPPLLPDRSPYCVAFDGPNDPNLPHNYSIFKKILITTAVGLSTFTLGLGSAMFASAIEDLKRIYDIGTSVAALGTSLFIIGFAAGPVIFGPSSEVFGRKPVMVVSSFAYVCFEFGTAAAKDLQTIMICRFFAGFLGSAPVVVSAAIMVDITKAKARGIGMACFGSLLFGSVMIGPILAGFIVKNQNLGWRWVSYISGISGSVALVFNVFTLDETHHPVLLARKAELLRRQTSNWGIYALHEEVSLDMKNIVVNRIFKPIILLFTEPIVFLISLYNSFIYGILYSFLTVIPLIFEGRYGWSRGVGELPYLSMLLGVLSGTLINILYEIQNNNKLEQTGTKPAPEMRLPPVKIGAVTFVIGIFWLGWTGDYPQHVHWIVPVIGAFFIGNGLMLIFLPTMTYLIDCYLPVAATALAGLTFIRSGFGAAFPLFTQQMFSNLTIKWASTLLGCLGVLIIPVPFFFGKYGAYVRSKSKHALH
ncbi:hypothetical protein KGF57_001242 [Candida theae]|uniref:Major facilitator superfamily (MFS) profile domain-containing protein n=1 Tax=Candida theae TaxID=1198502 RepID=A0AAD5BHF6_9ASCO|nr:uncharacterized protein KGF57_001242 [Candida theae]KAI5963866.1 hypothetical protein KGF57_001242 [Candida theae]